MQAMAQNSKTVRNKNYTKPIYFDVLGPQKQVPTVHLEYDMESRQGQALKIGPVTIDQVTFSFGHRTLREIDPRFQNSIADEVYFLANWPEHLYPEALLEILSRDGKVIWSRALRKPDLDNWNKVVQSALKFNKKTPLASVEWGIESSRSNLPFENLADGFRFCLSHYRVESQERLCSQEYVLRRINNQTLLGRLKSAHTPRVLVDGEPAPFKMTKEVQSGFPTRFFAQLATGETFDFSSKPLNVKWSDFVKVQESGVLRVVGHDIPPVGRYQILNPDRYAQWVENFGFEPTIGDTRKFWLVGVKESEPVIYFPGQDGGVFKHVLPAEGAPNLRNRLYLHKDTPIGTYRDGVTLRGRKQPELKVNSKEYEVSKGDSEQEFEWSFKASNDANINKSYLQIQDGDKTYNAYYELYKGYSNELSGRPSIILSSQGFILLGEVAYNHWFEDVLGWTNPLLSKQRWGLSGKYFQSLTTFKTEDFDKGSLTVMNLDLKYRLTPGLWTRDESHGIMVSYQNVDVDVQLTKFRAPMLGAGWFWARSMPRVFDELFNYFPFMNYPKWVDMEFIFYPMSMDSNVTMSTNFALNFHGQVLWKENFFGEAGFGIKGYGFTDKTNPYQANLGYKLYTLYGTLGIGIKF